MVRVDGEGSELWSASRIIVGTYGSGRLITSKGGTVHSESTISIGNQEESGTYDNLLQIDGKWSTVSAGELIKVGLLGKGTAVVSNNGTLNAPEIDIAVYEGASGELAIGARVGEDAATAGTIDVKQIIFGSGNGALTLNHTSNDFSLNADISGSGTINALSGVSALHGDNSAYQGGVNIDDPATLVVSEQKNISANNISATGGTLAINTDHDWRFINSLSGQGTLAVNAGGNSFDFDSSSLTDDFSGILALEETLFQLKGENTDALKSMQLKLGQGSTANVGAGQQIIGGLAFDGGTLVFGDIIPGQATTGNTVHTTETLDISGQGSVQVTTGAAFSNERATPDTHISVLGQDDGNTLVQLVSSDGGGIGNGGNITLIDQNSNTISDAVESDITQNGTLVAEGTYDYHLTSGDNNDGLYISYGLTQVGLLGKGADALILNANGKSGSAADLRARVTGSGDLAFDSQKGQTVTLSNMDNDYSGVTDVRNGNLAMLNDNVLGNTRDLKLAGDTEFDMRGYSQTIGKLTAESGSLTDLNGGHLTLTNGGEASGVLTGGGELTVAGGTLNVSGANTGLKATTTIAQGATAVLDNTLGLGTGDIVAAGLLNLSKATGALYNSISDAGKVALDASDVVLAGNNSHFAGIFDINNDSMLTASSAQRLGTSAIQNAGKFVVNTHENWSLENDVTGSGSVAKNGSGNVTLSDSAQWTGATDINAGGLTLGSTDNTFTLASHQVNIGKDGRLSGFGGVAGNIANQGTLLIGDDVSAASSPVSFTVGGNLTNGGDIWTGSKGKDAGNQLVVNGNYQGDGGHLHLNTALNDDNSVTDKLIVKGNTSGTTGVSVTNAGGSGAQTINGIEVIHVDGQSDGEFTQDGRIVAGAYDYSLARGQGDDNGNWYLTSYKTDPNPGTGPKPEPAIRPEPGSWTANLAAANTLFVTRLHDRLGETQYIDALTGEKKVTSMWMRQAGGHNAWRDSSGQLKTRSNRYVMQVGGDIARWSGDGLDRWHLGVMAGYGHNSSNTRSSSTGDRSDGSVNGYSAGVYATWYASDETHQGAYLDTWVQYSWFNNCVKGQDIQSESYKSKGITGSLELGYIHKLGEFAGSKGSKNEWFIQPQAQAIWMGVEADDHRESNGTRISGEGDGNVQIRLGVRTFLKDHSAINGSKAREFQPFVEVNWLHNMRDFGTKMDGVSIRQEGARNLGEIKTGVEGQINPQLNVWGNVGVQVGDKGYNDTSAMIGIKYNF
ncbi:autotransporter outer membrane beta-barrel domain-containing protein [Salmonella enterica]|nr:autotransporter outer membrane beta-barrel domain-containing protein [Salmonella enterica]